MKKGLLVVSFGTSYREAEEQNIIPVEQALTKAFPEYEMRRAYGSRRIIKKLRERDSITIDTIEEALKKFSADGYTELLIQPTYMIHGYEYNELMELVKMYKKEFASVRVGHSLLHQQSYRLFQKPS